MVSHVPGTPLSIGSPTPNNSVCRYNVLAVQLPPAHMSFVDILDEEMTPVPIGSPGVLWAGGKGIFAGYVNLPHLTDAKRKPDIYSGEG